MRERKTFLHSWDERRDWHSGWHSEPLPTQKPEQDKGQSSHAEPRSCRAGVLNPGGAGCDEGWRQRVPGDVLPAGLAGSSASSQKVGQAGAQARGDRFLRVEPELCARNQRRRAGVLSVREPGPWLPAVGRVAAQIC